MRRSPLPALRASQVAAPRPAAPSTSASRGRPSPPSAPDRPTTHQPRRARLRSARGPHGRRSLGLRLASRTPPAGGRRGQTPPKPPTPPRVLANPTNPSQLRLLGQGRVGGGPPRGAGGPTHPAAGGGGARGGTARGSGGKPPTPSRTGGAPADPSKTPPAAGDRAPPPPRPPRGGQVINVRRVASLRNVSGSPASAAQPSAAVTPGTTTTGTCACRRCSSSSPPRPKMKGSPLLSRTTLRPLRAASTRRAFISFCAMPGWPRRLPT